ncbi:MAG: aspartate aminotransferase [Caldisphaera sp.]|jgi:aspartate aminotransferase|uniref:pyridoxal phosphate-dependent aminotransferase n=1 Tax=Caldisphaera sp. TaxID=2060322 RepID=UPI000CBCA94D|nr:MAG: aspartate aminotransferase [Caldisphaera sp.]PMP91181.1 MAG: aspartate aminotransferase [Caldisphaera sp.]
MKFDIYDFFSELSKNKVKIRMDAGDPDIKPNDIIIDELTKNIRDLGYAPYKGLDELREVIAEYHKVDLDNVIITPGSKAAISSLILFSKKVNLISPYWSGYEFSANLFNKQISILNTELENSWEPNFSNIEKDTTLIINYPNNPTGKVITQKKIKELIDESLDKNLTIVSDEAYRDIVFDGFKFKLTDYILQNSVSIFSFSKTFSLPGLRLGYAVGDKQLIDKIGRFIKANITSVPKFSQRAAIKALEMWDSIADQVKDIYYKRLILFLNKVNNKKFVYVRPEGTFYVFLKLNGLSGTELAYNLAKKGIGIFPGEAFGNEFENFIRISLTTKEENIPLAADLINETIDEMKS